MKTSNYKLGHEFADGAITLISKYWIIGLVLLFLYSKAGDYFGWSLDDSDKDGGHRSGLSVHKDYKTGVEYLSDGHGGMVVRATKAEVEK